MDKTVIYSEEYRKFVRNSFNSKEQNKDEDILNKILNAIEEKENEPQYQHENEDWRIGLIMAEDIVREAMR